ncbi:hypothetical protein LTR28_003722 [Elasticomyces elasticus]|nr:hypothetical protein LTR28_003722 [Elasticomyces elasticus]
MRGDGINAPHGSAQPTKASRNKIDSTPAQTEKALFEANRRRLLERSDWLGLAPSRPVHMNFASLEDKERIGKRRKIERRLRPQHTQERRQLHDSFPANEKIACGPFMSGALPAEEDIRIHVGLDALVSQTQLSTTRSLPPNPTMLRCASSDSMLIEADVELREILQPAVFNAILTGNDNEDEETETKEREQQLRSEPYSNRPMIHMMGDFEQAVHSMPNQAAEHMTVYGNRLRTNSLYSGAAHVEDVGYSALRRHETAREDGRLVFCSTSDGELVSRSDHADATYSGHTPKNGSGSMSTKGFGPAGNRPLEEQAATYTDEDLDQDWRQWINISRDGSSQATNPMSKSSDATIEAPETTAVPEPAHEHSPITSNERTFSTPQGAGTQQTTTYYGGDTLWGNIGEQSEVCSKISPSASYKQILVLSQQPATRAAENTDEDALWKQFVFGGMGSARSVSPESEDVQQTDDNHGARLTSLSVAAQASETLIPAMQTGSQHLSSISPLSRQAFTKVPNAEKPVKGARPRKRRGTGISTRAINSVVIHSYAEQRNGHCQLVFDSGEKTAAT